MTGFGREMAAIRHELPDPVPTDAICTQPVAEIAEFLGIAVGQVADGLDSMAGSSPRPVWVLPAARPMSRR